MLDVEPLLGAALDAGGGPLCGGGALGSPLGDLHSVFSPSFARSALPVCSTGASSVTEPRWRNRPLRRPPATSVARRGTGPVVGFPFLRRRLTSSSTLSRVCP